MNLADEYINRKVRFGHWKDNAIRLKGEAVKNFTVMFLQMWDVCSKSRIRILITARILTPGTISILRSLTWTDFRSRFPDSPIDGNRWDTSFIWILSIRQRNMYIMTPYLVLDDDMITALTYAAKRGVDTVIIMPHIPDKSQRSCWPSTIRSL